MAEEFESDSLSQGAKSDGSPVQVPFAEAMDEAWRMVEFHIDPWRTTLAYPEEPDGLVELIPAWWVGEPVTGLAWVSASAGTLHFDPRDPWLTPMMQLRHPVDAGGVANLLGAEAANALVARHQVTQVQPTPELALLSRIAVGSWLARWEDRSGDDRVAAVWAVELAGLCWLARDLLGGDDQARLWLARAGDGVERVLDVLDADDAAWQVADLVTEARRHVPAASTDQSADDRGGAPDLPMPPRDLVAEVRELRRATARGAGMPIMQMDPDAPFLAEEETDRIAAGRPPRFA